MSVETITRMKEELQLSNKHNYSQYSNKNNHQASKTEKPARPKVDHKVAERSESATKPIAPAEVKMEPVVQPEYVAPSPAVLVNETIDTVTLPETVTGIVVKCTKLNVRVEPNTFADVICVLDADAEIQIDVSQSNNEWFKIYTATGVEGYCMRKFVNAHL